VDRGAAPLLGYAMLSSLWLSMEWSVRSKERTMTNVHRLRIKKKPAVAKQATLREKIEDDEKKVYLTVKGRHKALSRLCRYGQVLPASSFKVLIFIYDRTIGFGNSFESIPYKHFREGVVRRKDGVRICGGVGLGLTTIKKAIRNLIEIGVVTRYRTPTLRGTYYWLNYEWSQPGLLPMWEITEDDYDYPTEEPFLLAEEASVASPLATRNC
jgi:hypothetical protein